jgi:hypothetical protein
MLSFILTNTIFDAQLSSFKHSALSVAQSAGAKSPSSDLKI